jgi:hypothetical protein
VDGTFLVLHLPLRQKAASFHTDIRVPLTAVRSVQAVDDPWTALRGRRMAGVALRGGQRWALGSTGTGSSTSAS